MLGRALILIALLMPLPALAQLRWIEGQHYVTIPGGQQAELQPGKIEVAEVFSYGCIHCYQARDVIEKLRGALPADAYMTYVHASFRPDEGWPMYQRAWYTAQAMSIGTATHEAMFKAVWETFELGVVDAAGNPRKPLPTIEQAAKFYARAGKVKEADFVKVARSAGVEAKIKRADAQIKAWRIPGTPAVVVNGRYLVKGEAMAKWDDVRMLVLYLISQERARIAKR